jgi:hypothetical protein
LSRLPCQNDEPRFDAQIPPQRLLHPQPFSALDLHLNAFVFSTVLAAWAQPPVVQHLSHAFYFLAQTLAHLDFLALPQALAHLQPLSDFLGKVGLSSACQMVGAGSFEGVGTIV